MCVCIYVCMHGVVWCDVVWCGVVWYVTAWYGMCVFLYACMDVMCVRIYVGMYACMRYA